MQFAVVSAPTSSNPFLDNFRVADNSPRIALLRLDRNVLLPREQPLSQLRSGFPAPEPRPFHCADSGGYSWQVTRFCGEA